MASANPPAVDRFGGNPALPQDAPLNPTLASASYFLVASVDEVTKPRNPTINGCSESKVVAHNNSQTKISSKNHP